MQFNRFTHLNDTHAIQNSGILQFSKIIPQSLCNIIIPWSIKYMWFNAAHSLLILTSPNCSLIRGHFPVWCGGRCTAPGGVAYGQCPDGSGRRPDGSGRLLVGPLERSRWGNPLPIAINAISLKTRFFGLHFRCRKHWCIFNHFYVILPEGIRWNYAALKAITPFKVIQGHRVWYQSKSHMRLPISD